MQRCAPLLFLAAVALVGPAASGAPAAPDPAPGEAAPVAATPVVPPPTGRALTIAGGQERFVDAAQAAQQGYTIVDLSDDWTPFLFEELRDPSGAPLPNRYRSVFLGLANDTGDDDGQPLPP